MAMRDEIEHAETVRHLDWADHAFSEHSPSVTVTDAHSLAASHRRPEHVGYRNVSPRPIEQRPALRTDHV